MALFETHGYQVARTMVEMIRPMGPSLADAPMPEGLELHPACAEEYRSIWDAWKEAYADHWESMERTEEDYRRWTESRLFQPELWKIAWDDKEVAGLALNSIDARRNEWIGIARGYTQYVFVRRPWRRRGLARALVTSSIRMFGEMGMAETYLGVDTESPTGANVLYASLGYQPRRRHLIYRKPHEL